VALHSPFTVAPRCHRTRPGSRDDLANADGTDCALNGGCYIGTQDAIAGGATAATLIQFDPNIPPLPPLEIAVRIDKTPAVNAKGVVALKGTVKCTNRGAAFVEVDLDLTQVFHRSIFESFGAALVSCAAAARGAAKPTLSWK
jgi:hypothetical protein